MSEFKKLTTSELKKKMDAEEGFVLIDVLGEMSYEKAHLPGAISIDAHEDDFVDKVKEKVGDMSKEVIVYCASFSCQLSPSAAKALVSAGFENVYDYEGGLADWAKQGNDFEGAQAEEKKESLAKAG